MMRIVACWLALVLFTVAPAMAQPAPAPAPVVTATIDPPRVVVGQKATLVVTVLAPNYMPAPPVLPDFQVRNAVTRSLGSINQVDQREGVTYAGVRYEFAMYPQEPGSYAVAGQSVTVTYAADPPQSRTATIALTPLAFEAFIPDAAQDLDPFVAATGLIVEQTVKQSSQELKVGDSVIRTVTAMAEGTPAMLLPPATFVRVDGLAPYLAQPSLQDNLDRRTGALTATRIDETTYMLERPGEYTLPAIDLAWWNVRDGKIDRAHADAIVLHVADAPALRDSGTYQEKTGGWNWDAYIDLILDHWLFLIAALVLLGTMIWVAPVVARAVRQRVMQRQSAYLDSEAWSFARLRAAFHDRDPTKIYFALLNWLERFEPFAPHHTLDALKQAARDPALDYEIASLETSLFAPRGSQAAVWPSGRLLKRLNIARRRLRALSPAHAMREGLPDSLNPVAAHAPSVLRQRPVVR